MLKRKAYEILLEWKKNSKGSTALLVQGARRVGKSTLVKHFASQEYKSFLFIDFFRAPQEIKDCFTENSNDFDTLFFLLQAYYKVKLYNRKSIIIFDEIQCFPFARGLIKYLVKDGRYDYIETGSLLSIKQNIQDIIIPSEEETLNLRPLDFEEFCWAVNEKQLSDLIKYNYEKLEPLPDLLHKKANLLLREYMLIGGMPKPVSIYTEKRAFQPVDAEKRRILELYRNDISRFAHGYEFKVCSVLDGIPSQLSKHEKKFALSSINKNARMRDYEESFFWLADAQIVNIAYAAADPHVGLALNMEQSSLKCYMADTGLLVSLAFSDSWKTTEDIYRAVLLDKIGINEGMLIENLVSQALVASGHKLFFYSNSGKKEGEDRMEIDFLISKPYPNAANKPRISPVEVKSPRQYGTASLDKFKARFKKRIGCQYVLHIKQLKVEQDRIFLPLYMAMCL